MSEPPSVYKLAPVPKVTKMTLSNSHLINSSAPILQPALILHILKVFATIKVHNEELLLWPATSRNKHALDCSRKYTQRLLADGK